MHKSILLILVTVFSIAYVPPAARAGEVVLQPGPDGGKDTCWGTVYVDGVTQTCYDNAELYTGGWGDFYYDYFEFDLTGAPRAAETVSVVLHLYFNHAGKNDPAFEIHRVTEPWTESGVTRYSNPAATFYRTWGTPIMNTAWYTVDITDLFVGWQNGTYPNYGIKLVPTRNNETNASVNAAEYGNPTLRPKLVITTTGTSLTVQRLGVGSGRITSDPGGIDCGDTCSSTFRDGSRVRLTAVADPGSTFVGWGRSNCQPDRPCTVVMDGDQEVSGTFIVSPTTTANKIIYVAVCGAGFIFDDACLEGRGWYDPRDEATFSGFNPMSDEDLNLVGFNFSGFDAIALRVAALHPTSVTLVTSFSVSKVLLDLNPYFIRKNVPAIVDFVEGVYNPGDRIYLVGHSAGGGIIQEAAKKLGRKGIPVQMTGQFDSVGLDARVSSDVTRAFNYYYPGDSSLCSIGWDIIEAAKRSSTIVSNEPIDFPNGPDALDDFCGGHKNMDNDRKGWRSVLDYILGSAP